MNNDLISREALKKAINDNGCRHSHYFDIFDVIDNVPTVEGYKNVIVGGMNNPYNAGYMDGIRQAYKELERHQGEWIDYSDDGFVECPACGRATTCDGNKDELHFCWNCGARMGKGGRE